MDKEIKQAIVDSNLSKQDKKLLKDTKTRAELNIEMTKILLVNRVTKKKKNYEEHGKLSYLNDDSDFKKTVISILKRI